MGVGSRLDYKSQVTTSLSLLSIKSFKNCIGNIHKNTNMNNGSKGLGIRVLGLNSGFTINKY